MKRAFTLILSIMVSMSTFGQTDVQKTFWNDPFSHPMLPFVIVTAFVFVVMWLVLAVAIYVIRILNLLTAQAEREKAQALGKVQVPEPGWRDRLTQWMNASAPLEQEGEIELDHSYDGIKELDNHLPPWWTALFYSTIIFAVVYIVVYHFSDTLPLQEQEYHTELTYAEEQARKFKASQPQAVIDETALSYTADQNIIEKGKLVFTNNNCGACHRNDGGGNTIGPNLTDAYWLHGGDVKQVFGTVKNGVIEKGMPAWGKVMSPEDVRDVTFYILSLRGTNPAKAKAPQGQLFEEVKNAMDSTTVQASL
jgi:cytochrome c oxidase cbb3-type subunit III